MVQVMMLSGQREVEARRAREERKERVELEKRLARLAPRTLDPKP